jgi:hypothetical protein
VIAEPALPAEPVLFRIARWPSRPDSVSAIGPTLAINQGGVMDQAEDEEAANGTDESSWYYDSEAQRLVVKVVPAGAAEPGAE